MTDLYDFHTHTTLSDGVLLPIEMVRRALARGYTAMALTDHASLGNLREVIAVLLQEAALARKHWPIEVLAGVELTHVPAAAIAEAAREARAAGAEIVVVHGETPVEPVEPGTNHAAVTSSDVDLLAHPGQLSAEDALLAARHEVFVELTARRGHSLCNGHVQAVGRAAGVRFVIDSDSHEPGDLLTVDFAQRVALGSGLPADMLDVVLLENPRLLLGRARRRR